MRFDSSNRNWAPDMGHNRLFLNGVQNHMNDLLKARGHVLLNDVLDALGIPRTKEGATSGWVKTNGFYSAVVIYNEDDLGHAEKYQDAIVLTFNCRPDILDRAFPPPREYYVDVSIRTKVTGETALDELQSTMLKAVKTVSPNADFAFQVEPV